MHKKPCGKKKKTLLGCLFYNKEGTGTNCAFMWSGRYVWFACTRRADSCVALEPGRIMNRCHRIRKETPAPPSAVALAWGTAGTAMTAPLPLITDAKTFSSLATWLAPTEAQRTLVPAGPLDSGYLALGKEGS